jgi:Mrp family chromosome partitioning ATPase
LAEIANARSLRCADAPLDEPNSRFVRDIVRLVLQLEARPRENREGGAVIAITAAEPSESKSAIAVALARFAARMGKKVVLVDCDPARTASGVLHAPLAGGVYEVLTGTMPLNHALARDARGKAWLLGMPRRPPNAAAMFGSSKMRQLLATLSEGADIVILDCPVVLAGPEAALIARLAAATLLIVPREKMGAASLTNAASVLEKAQGAPIGVVMAA